MTKQLLATQEGIKTVGVGRKGSRPLGEDLIRRIRAEIRRGEVPDAVLGAFLAGLIMKGPTEAERSLEACFQGARLDDPGEMTAQLAAQAPEEIREICRRLLGRQELSCAEARRLGDYLFGTDATDSLCGLVASLLRVRYETPDEYEGLLNSMQGALLPEFREPAPNGKPVVAVAEPFDGAARSYAITPLVMRHVQASGYRVVGLCGRNSGPKFGNNLRSLAIELGGPFLTRSSEFTDTPLDYGWFADQVHMSPALDRWVDIRRQIIKRPFLATLERFVDPCRADVMVASAFHPPYGEKMVTICERAGFPAAVIVRNGMEGSIAFPLIRAARVLCCVRRKTGEYLRREFVLDPAQVLDEVPAKEERRQAPELSDNVRLIQEYREHGRTAEPLFDLRVAVTCAGLSQALDWIRAYKEGDETDDVD